MVTSAPEVLNLGKFDTTYPCWYNMFMRKIDLPIPQPIGGRVHDCFPDDVLANRYLDIGRIMAFEDAVRTAQSADAQDVEAAQPTLVTRAGSFVFDPSIFSEAQVRAEETINSVAAGTMMRYLGRWARRGSEESVPAELRLRTHFSLPLLFGATAVQVVRETIEDR